MRILFLFAIGFLTISHVKAQDNILRDPVTNRVFNPVKYSEISGSPFLFDKWINGSATISKGYYDNLEIKLDSYTNTLLFKKEEETYEFQDDILSFVLKPTPTDSSSYLYFKKGVSGQNLAYNQYVQVLVEGRVGFYKSQAKSMAEVNQINKGVVQSFTKTDRYYIFKNNVAHLVRLNKSEALSLLNEKQEQLEAFIDKEKLSLRKEADVIKVIRYYNSI
jgi:hypothetical protein